MPLQSYLAGMYINILLISIISFLIKYIYKHNSLCRCSSIQNYGERYQSGSGGFETVAFFQAFGDFVGIFSLSLFIGATMGCLTALLTKFTRVRDFPLLESALFVLMSYSTFLIAEASDRSYR